MRLTEEQFNKLREGKSILEYSKDDKFAILMETVQFGAKKFNYAYEIRYGNTSNPNNYGVLKTSFRAKLAASKYFHKVIKTFPKVNFGDDSIQEKLIKIKA